MNFKKWYKDPKHQKLFTEGGFKPQSSARYNSLVKRFNVFIEYYNGMNGDFVDTSKGNQTQEVQVCSNIVENSQFAEFNSGQKERFDRLKKDKEKRTSTFTDLVNKDVKKCGREILSCCQGEFPKSS